MAMRDDGEGFADVEPNDLGNEDQQVWYFDVPDGAWARQEQKNKDLRAMVRNNLSEKPQKQKAFSPQPQTFGAEAEEKAAKRGLGFGRRKEEPRGSGDSWRQNREPMSFDEMSTTPASAWDEGEPEPRARQEPPARGTGAPLRPKSREWVGSDAASERPAAFQDPERRENGPLPLRVRRSAPPPPLTSEENERSAPAGGSRWDAMFSGPADMSIVDAMRAWSNNDEPHVPKQIPLQREAKQEPGHDPAARFADLDDVEVSFGVPPASDAPEEPGDEPDSAVSDFLARIRGRKAGMDQAPMRSLESTMARSVPRPENEAPAPTETVPAVAPLAEEPFRVEPAAASLAPFNDETPVAGDEPGTGIENPADILGGMRAWAAGKSERRPRTFGSLAEAASPAPVPPARLDPAPTPIREEAPAARVEPTAMPQPVVEPAAFEDNVGEPTAAVAGETHDGGVENPADILGGMRAWAAMAKTPREPRRMEPIARTEPEAPAVPLTFESFTAPEPVVEQGTAFVAPVQPAPAAPQANRAEDTGFDNPADIMSGMRAWATKRDRPQHDAPSRTHSPLDEPSPFALEQAAALSEPLRAPADWTSMRTAPAEVDDGGDWEMPAPVARKASKPATEDRVSEPSDWLPMDAMKSPPAAAAADEPLTLWASANDDILAVDEELNGVRGKQEKKGGFLGKLFGRKKKEQSPEPPVTDSSEWLMPEEMNRLDAPKPMILGADTDEGWLPPEGQEPSFIREQSAGESPWQAMQADALAGAASEEVSFEAFIATPLPAPVTPSPAAASADEWTWESLASITPVADVVPVEVATPVAVDTGSEWDALAELAVEAPAALVEPGAVEVAQVEEDDTPWSFAEMLTEEAPVALVEPGAVEVAGVEEDDTPWSFAEMLTEEAPVALVEPAAVEVAGIEEGNAPWSFAEVLTEEAPVALVEPAAVEVAQVEEDDTPWSFAEVVTEEAPVALIEPVAVEVAQVEEDDTPWSFAEVLTEEAPVALVEPAPVEVAQVEDDIPSVFVDLLSPETPVATVEPIALADAAVEEAAPLVFVDLLSADTPVASVEVVAAAAEAADVPWSPIDSMDVEEPVALATPASNNEPEWDYGAWFDSETTTPVAPSPQEDVEDEGEPFDFAAMFEIAEPSASITGAPADDEEDWRDAFGPEFACFDHEAVTAFVAASSRWQPAIAQVKPVDELAGAPGEDELEWGFVEELAPSALVEPVEFAIEPPLHIFKPEEVGESADPSYAWVSDDAFVFEPETVKEDDNAFSASLSHHGETMSSESRRPEWEEDPQDARPADPFAPRFDTETDDDGWNPEPAAEAIAPAPPMDVKPEQPEFDFGAAFEDAPESGAPTFDEVDGWAPEAVTPAASAESDREGFDLFSAPMSEVAGRYENPRTTTSPSAPAFDEASSRDEFGWDAVVNAATEMMDDDTPQPLVRVSRGYAGYAAPTNSTSAPEMPSVEDALANELAAAESRDGAPAVPDYDDDDSGIEEFDMSNWRAAWKKEQESASPEPPAAFTGDDNESGWELGNDTDVVLRAFEAHARQDIPEPAPKEEIAAELFRYSQDEKDDFEDLLGDDAKELVSESGDMEVDERTGFARVAGWAPQRTILTDEEELPPWAVRANGVSESRTNWVGTPGRLEDLAPPWASAAEEEEEVVDSRKRSRSIVRELVETGLLAILVFLSVRASFQNFKVDGRSMEPTLEDGEFLIVNKLVYSKIDMERLAKFIPFIEPGSDPQRNVFHPPERGDIIVLKHPAHPETDLIKRVVGLPGETVQIKEGVVYINGQPLTEDYIDVPWQYTGPSTPIPQGEYFVMGDNRNNSSDSRASIIGLIPEELIIGKAMVTYWPTDKFGFAPNEAGKVAAAGLGSLTEASQAPLFGARTVLFMLEVACGITLLRWTSRRVFAFVRGR